MFKKFPYSCFKDPVWYLLLSLYKFPFHIQVFLVWFVSSFLSMFFFFPVCLRALGYESILFFFLRVKDQILC